MLCWVIARDPSAPNGSGYVDPRTSSLIREARRGRDGGRHGLLAASRVGVVRVTREWDAALMAEEAHDYYELIQQSTAGPPRPRFSVPRERPAFLRIWRADDGRLWLWPGSPGSSQEVTDEQREAFSTFLSGRTVPPRFWNHWSPTDGLDVFDREGRWLGHVPTPPTWDGR